MCVHPLMFLYHTGMLLLIIDFVGLIKLYPPWPHHDHTMTTPSEEYFIKHIKNSCIYTGILV